jgi:hypothetical protein
MQLGPGMEEAIRRMEAGEDPEQIEAEMGDVLESEDPFVEGDISKGLKALRKQSQRPQVDTTLYEL